MAKVAVYTESERARDIQEINEFISNATIDQLKGLIYFLEQTNDPAYQGIINRLSEKVVLMAAVKAVN